MHSSTSTSSARNTQWGSCAESSVSDRIVSLLWRVLSVLWHTSSRVATNGIKNPFHPREEEVKCDSKVHSMFRPGVRKLLEMSLLRDNTKRPVKELSDGPGLCQILRNSDIANVERLLKYVNNTRDLILIDPQVPDPDVSGFIPVQIVSFSDSDWGGCQKSR